MVKLILLREGQQQITLKGGRTLWFYCSLVYSGIAISKYALVFQSLIKSATVNWITVF